MAAEVDMLEEWVGEQGMLGELGDIRVRLQLRQGRLHLHRLSDPRQSAMEWCVLIMDRSGMQTRR
jgi:hypothetical protein